MASNGNETPEQSEQPQPIPPPQQPTSSPSGGLFGIPTRLLLIGGGGGGAVVVIVIVVALLFVTGVIGGGGASGGSDVLGYVPADSDGILILDNRAYLGGDVPDDLVDYLEEEEDRDDSFGISTETYDLLDIDEDDVELHVWTANQNFDPELEIVQGELDFEVIREELEDGLDCEDDDYRGFELWECPGRDFPAVALFEKDGFVVFAVRQQEDLEDLLTLKSREEDQLANADDSEIQRILDQTRSGWLQIAFIGRDRCPISRCDGFAIAVGESDDEDAIPGSFALMFGSERVATSNEDNIEIDDLIEGFFAGFHLQFEIEEVQADGEFVVGEGTSAFIGPDAESDAGSSQPGQIPAAATSTPATGESRPATPASQPAAIAQPTPRATPTSTPAPIREPQSTLNLIPAESHRIEIIRWDQTQSGNYLPSNVKSQVFQTTDRVRNDYDISPDNISEIVFVREQDLTVLHGNFDLGSVRNMLENQGREQMNYRGYELWTDRRYQIILFDSYIAYSTRGGLENILQNLYRGSGSLAHASENNDMRRLLSKFSEGIIITADRDCRFENCLVYGWTVNSIDEATVTGKGTVAFLFRNSRSAAASAADDYDDIVRLLRGSKINVADTIAEENYVVGEAVWDFSS